jgi:hypothetical protein
VGALVAVAGLVLLLLPAAIALAMLANLPAPDPHLAAVPIDPLAVLRWASLPASLLVFLKPDRPDG